jgi:MFS family permease
MSTLNKRAVLAIILTSYVMIVLDTSVVLTGLPRIHQELGFTDTGLAWVKSAYTLTFGGFLLLAARAGDLLGRRSMLTAGLAIFTAASVAIGLAQSPQMMIAARAIQGLGAAILAVCSRRRPASVGLTLRVVRVSSRMPRRVSRPRIVWLRADCDRPICLAALVKLPSRATATNASRSL